MKFLLFITIVSFSCGTLQAWIDVDETLHEKGTGWILNEVKFQTKHALKTAKALVNERFLGNQSQDVVVDMAEILNKAQTTLSKIEKWIKENNRTGELVRDAEDCVLNILEETTDETLDYLAKLEKLCWNTQDWDAPIRSILEYITDMADEGENLYYEFLKDIAECQEDRQCVAVADDWIRAEAVELLQGAIGYMDFLTSVGEEYEANGRLCQETIKGRIAWIASNVIDGLQECKRKKS